MKRRITTLCRDRMGATAVEFAMVLPLLLLLLLGIIDAGRWMWTLNRAEKATQFGVRYAVVTDMVPNGLTNYSFAAQGNVPQGQVVDQSNFGGASCTFNGTVATCTCKTAKCGPANLINNQANANAAFGLIVKCMHRILGELPGSAVQVDYINSGLGFSGDPNGPDISPLVRVSIVKDGIPFTPIALFNQLTFPMPQVSAELTMEDGQGSDFSKCPSS
ncbi:TadE-like protein [Sphingobium faniae]|nr:TadE-like protein [Sphingobium faniae]